MLNWIELMMNSYSIHELIRALTDGYYDYKIQDSRFKNFIGITPTDASFTNVTQGKQYKHAYSLHNNNNQKNYGYTMIHNEYWLQISMYLNLIILS